MNKAGDITIRKRNGKYEYRFEVEPIDGKRQWKTKGGFLLKKEAMRAGKQARDEYLKTGGRPTRKQDNISFNTLAESYLERVLKKDEPTTYTMYKTYFEKYFCPFLGNMAVKQIEFSDIEDLMQHISNHKLSQSRIDGAKTVLHEVFAYAIKIRVITENPVEFTDMEFYGTEAEEKVPYTLEQIQQIFKTVPDDSPYRIVFVLGIFCGLRIGEILGLTWDHVDFEKGTIKIEKQMANIRYEHKAFHIIKKPKSKKSVRTVHISKTVKKELMQVKNRQEEDRKAFGQEYLRPQTQDLYMQTKKLDRVVDAYDIIEGNKELLLVCRKRNGGHMQSRAVDAYMRTLSKKMGFHLTSHLGRHTHATLLLEKGANIVNISSRLGHNNTEITMEYLHNTEDADILMAQYIESTLASVK